MIPLASRVMVTLEYLGMNDNVYLLNGGLKQWESENKVVEDKTNDITLGMITKEANTDILVDKQWIANNLRGHFWQSFFRPGKYP